jgi:hypothetical protein
LPVTPVKLEPPSSLCYPCAGAAAGALKLEKLRLGLNGRNWGTWQVSGKTLEWRETEEGADGSSSGSAAGRLIAAVPLAAVSQAAHPGKGEVEVQFFDEGALPPAAEPDGSGLACRRVLRCLAWG